MNKFIYIAILSIYCFNVLSLSNELKEAIINLDSEKTQNILKKEYKSFDSIEKKELINLAKKIRAELYKPLKICKLGASLTGGILGAQVFFNFFKRFCIDNVGTQSNIFIPIFSPTTMYGSSPYTNLFKRFLLGISWGYNPPEKNYIPVPVNIPMIAFSGILLYNSINQITQTVKRIEDTNRILQLIFTYIGSNF